MTKKVINFHKEKKNILRSKKNNRVRHRNFLTENPYTDDYLYLDNQKSIKILEKEYEDRYEQAMKEFKERWFKLENDEEIKRKYTPCYKTGYDWLDDDCRYNYVYGGTSNYYWDYYVPFGFPEIQLPIVFFG